MSQFNIRVPYYRNAVVMTEISREITQSLRTNARIVIKINYLPAYHS
jgi:hypothetical protein